MATIAKIGDEELTVTLDSGREISFEKDHFRHIDHGYAVTSHSSQGTTVDRVLINADTSESRVLLNDRMGYVAVSRARDDAVIYTNSIEELRGALDRRVDKEMALEAMNSSQDQRQTRHDESSHAASQNHEKPFSEKSIEEDAFDTTLEQADSASEPAQSEEMEFTLA